MIEVWKRSELSGMMQEGNVDVERLMWKRAPGKAFEPYLPCIYPTLPSPTFLPFHSPLNPAILHHKAHKKMVRKGSFSSVLHSQKTCDNDN